MKAFTKLFFLFFVILLAVFWFGKNDLGNFISFEIKRTAIVENSNVATENLNNLEEGESWSFAVIGDTEGIRPVTERMVKNMAKQDIDFVVHLGDLTQTAEIEDINAVLDLFDTLEIPTYYIPGNNDLVYDEVIERKTRTRYTTLVNNNLHYSFLHNNSHFIFLDNSYRRDGFIDEELSWLKSQLEDAQPIVEAGEVAITSGDTTTTSALKKRVASYDNTFLFYHRPLDVPGQQLFGDDETAASREQNKQFKDLIADYEITRIFNGHLHTTLSYTLDSIPVTISGGGGAVPQSILGGEKAAFYHYYIVHIPADGTTPLLELVDFE